MIRFFPTDTSSVYFKIFFSDFLFEVITVCLTTTDTPLLVSTVFSVGIHAHHKTVINLYFSSEGPLRHTLVTPFFLSSPLKYLFVYFERDRRKFRGRSLDRDPSIPVNKNIVKVLIL